ncbi:hypothetical protein E4U13_007630, partial [Claviceps humidiphila]
MDIPSGPIGHFDSNQILFNIVTGSQPPDQNIIAKTIRTALMAALAETCTLYVSRFYYIIHGNVVIDDSLNKIAQCEVCSHDEDSFAFRFDASAGAPCKKMQYLPACSRSRKLTKQETFLITRYG